MINHYGRIKPILTPSKSLYFMSAVNCRPSADFMYMFGIMLPTGFTPIPFAGRSFHTHTKIAQSFPGDPVDRIY